MNEAQVRTVEEVRQVLQGTQSLEFRRAEDEEGPYAWIEGVLRRFDYRQLPRTHHVLVWGAATGRFDNRSDNYKDVVPYAQK